ncbi:zinc finger protein 626-like [Phlebotomus argentipes]|uniref:zinc finger protein 626-like n=1 Tax=Phlebotomus argentipes TaxID=94469 RepID=UPI0028929C45|nr:zinc finger protein 626-like [Phlebotomus argentipes]
MDQVDQVMDIKKEIEDSDCYEPRDEFIDSEIVKEEYDIQDETSNLVTKKIDAQEEEQHECPLCEKVYQSAHSLGVHFNIHNCRDKKFLYRKSYKCGICGKDFMNKSSLLRHITIHSNVRNFECALCSKKFKSKQNIGRHMKIHTQRPQPCPQCKNILKNLISLKYHVKFHCQVTKHLRQKGICTICNKAYATKYSLNRHNKRLHKDSV